MFLLKSQVLKPANLCRMTHEYSELSWVLGKASYMLVTWLIGSKADVNHADVSHLGQTPLAMAASVGVNHSFL